jgi:hypothetical protein
MLDALTFENLGVNFRSFTMSPMWVFCHVDGQKVRYEQICSPLPNLDFCHFFAVDHRGDFFRDEQ